MERFWLQGVVKNGQVVLEKPLDLPDGTIVTVMDYDPDDDLRPGGPKIDMSDEDFAELSAFLSGKRDKRDWPDFEAQLVKKYGPLSRS